MLRLMTDSDHSSPKVYQGIHLMMYEKSLVPLKRKHLESYFMTTIQDCLHDHVKVQRTDFFTQSNNCPSDTWMGEECKHSLSIGGTGVCLHRVYSTTGNACVNCALLNEECDDIVVDAKRYW